MGRSTYTVSVPYKISHITESNTVSKWLDEIYEKDVDPSFGRWLWIGDGHEIEHEEHCVLADSFVLMDSEDQAKEIADKIENDDNFDEDDYNKIVSNYPAIFIVNESLYESEEDMCAFAYKKKYLQKFMEDFGINFKIEKNAVVKQSM